MSDIERFTDKQITEFKVRLGTVPELIERTCAELALSLTIDRVEFDGQSASAEQEREDVTNLARDIAQSAASYALGLARVLKSPGAEWPLHPNLSPEVFAEAADNATRHVEKSIAEQSLIRGSNG